MYKFFKKIFLTLIPRDFLIKHEFTFRKIVSIFFYGNKVYCSVCENSFRKFQKINKNDRLCVCCGSIPRQRLLWKYLTKNKLIFGEILHFSPNNFFYKKLKGIHNNYYSTEYENNAKTDFHFDITKIDSKSDSYDLIICYHILEHIVDDKKAMLELYRITKKGGQVILQVPFSTNNNTYEDYSITSPKDRLKAFGQEDHVRIYGKHDFTNRLNEAGFETYEINTKDIVSTNEINRLGLNPKEVIIIAKK